MLRLVWEGETETVSYRTSSTYPTTAAWPSEYIAAFCTRDTRRGYGSILAHVLFFILYNSNKGKHWNPLEFVGICWNSPKCGNSNGFQWKPFPEAPGFQMILVDSIGFHWKFHGMENQKGCGSSQMDSVGSPCNSDIPVRIWRISPELMGESKDLDQN